MKSFSPKPLVAIAIATCLLGLAAVQVQAQDLKIGYVDRDRVLREALPAKVADAKFRAEFLRRDKEMQELGDKLKLAAERFDKDQLTLTDSERQRRQRELVEQEREAQRKRREHQEDLNQRRNEELASLFERTGKVIKQIGEVEKFDLILQEAFYASPRLDITEKVIKALNAQAGK